MQFVPHTQEQLKAMKVRDGDSFFIEYKNKDYFNGEESLERGFSKALVNGSNIYFSVLDPYGMDKMVIEVRVLYKKPL
ncbi:MAG: hypothetical protein JXQ66_01360 [Campylobacterales bacterium]|nr:hypothetical protein [Campylobacterales bacterium]